MRTVLAIAFFVVVLVVVATATYRMSKYEFEHPCIRYETKIVHEAAQNNLPLGVALGNIALGAAMSTPERDVETRRCIERR